MLLDHVPGWLDQLRELVSVSVGGDRVLVLRADVESLQATPASTAVRLLLRSALE